MKFFSCFISCLFCFNLFAQEEESKDINPHKQHCIGLKYNLTLGNLLAHDLENYDPVMYYNTVPLELTYTYIASTTLSYNIGIMAGNYRDQYHSDRFASTYDIRHSMNYVGVKPGLGLQTSQMPGKGIFHYNIAIFYASELMQLSISDGYVGFSSYYEEIKATNWYVYVELGHIHQIPLHKKGNVRLLIDYGLQINPYGKMNRFKQDYLRKKQTPVPGIGTMSLFSPYISLGLGFGFNR